VFPIRLLKLGDCNGRYVCRSDASYSVARSSAAPRFAAFLPYVSLPFWLGRLLFMWYIPALNEDVLVFILFHEEFITILSTYYWICFLPVYITRMSWVLCRVKTYAIDVNTSRTPEGGAHGPCWPNGLISIIINHGRGERTDHSFAPAAKRGD
jgi:hypothetical protein